MAGKFRIAKTATQAGQQNGTVLKGGNFEFGAAVIRCVVKVGTNDEADGFIVRRKGARKFIVSDGTNEGVCYLANTPAYEEDEFEDPVPGTGLEDNTFIVVCTRADESTFLASKIDNRFVWDQDNTKYLVSSGAPSTLTTPPTVNVTTDEPEEE